MTDQNDTPDTFFISEDGQWNADPIEPCMIEAFSGHHYHERVAAIKAEIKAYDLRMDNDTETIATLAAELDESRRLLGIGGSREARLMAERDSLTERNADLFQANHVLTAERDALQATMDKLRAAWDACEFHGSIEEKALDELFYPDAAKAGDVGDA